MSTSKSPPSEEPAPGRDREATMRRFVDAAARVLARDGPAKLGVNAVAAEAGADKKLIYRYFGSFDGLIEAMGAEVSLWGGDLPEAAVPGARYGDVMQCLIQDYADRVREDPVLQKLLAWELTGPDDTLKRMDAARSRAMYKRMQALRGDAEPPEGVDAPAINAILLAAINHLALRSSAMGGFAGMKLTTDKDWQRVMAAVSTLIAAAYGPGEDTTQS